MKTDFKCHRTAALAGVAACVLALAGCAGGLPAFDLEGHRGARGLAPENTLAAFETAMALGVTTLELDTAVTADGFVVVSHDTLLNPTFTRDAEGRWLTAPGPPIRRLTLDELFERVAQRGDRRVRFNIETKSSPLQPELTPEPQAFVEALLAVIRRHGMEQRVMLQSFDWRTLQVAQRLAPRIPTVYLSSQQGSASNIADPRWTAGLLLAAHGSVPKMVKAAGGAVWSPNFNDVNAELVREAQSLGLKVVVWTVNEPAQIDKMLALGVDGIISDRPDRVRSAMAARGMPLP